MKTFVYGTLVVLISGICCWAAPEPAVVQTGDDWTVDVSFERLQPIVVKSAGQEKEKVFWYTILTVTNKTGRDVGFYPKCDLVTDTLQVVEAGKKVEAEVFAQIKKRHEGGYKFLELLEKTSHKILQGTDHTKDIAIIWPDFDGRAKNVKLFIAGLSNETAVINHPTAKGTDGKPVKVYLRKTLQLSYDIAGDPAFRSEAKVTFKGKNWVMR